MRVITGSARGRRLDAPPGQDTRPTAAKVKEAVFSVIQFRVEGAAVADLFAGSGQMGIEALSRGARSCIFVDNGRAAQEVLRQNLAATKLEKEARVIPSDVLAYLSIQRGPFDIVFVDPPYKAGLMPALLERLSPCMSGDGIVLCETASTEALPQSVGSLVLHREYRYGKTKITAYYVGAEGEKE